MTRIPVITLEVQNNHTQFSDMAFSANWLDETFRYHVWIGLRPDVDGERPPYPVKIGGTIYKNKINDRMARTGHHDINAAAHVKIKAEIKRLATYDTLMRMFNERREAIDAADAMCAEADRLNRLYDALATVCNASVDDLAVFNNG